MSATTVHSVQVQAMVVEEDEAQLGLVLFEAEHYRNLPSQVEDIAVSSAVTEELDTARPALRVQQRSALVPALIDP